MNHNKVLLKRRKCDHEWEFHPDQDDTGTNGVRKFCKLCGKVLTFYVENREEL